MAMWEPIGLQQPEGIHREATAPSLPEGLPAGQRAEIRTGSAGEATTASGAPAASCALLRGSEASRRSPAARSALSRDDTPCHAFRHFGSSPPLLENGGCISLLTPQRSPAKRGGPQRAPHCAKRSNASSVNEFHWLVLSTMRGGTGMSVVSAQGRRGRGDRRRCGDRRGRGGRLPHRRRRACHS